MCDSSFEGEIERVFSEKEKAFDKVPQDTLYMFKFKDVKSTTYKIFQYLLEEGKTLPYSTIVKSGSYFFFLIVISSFSPFLEKNVSFSKFMKPDFIGMEFVACDEKKENCFVFQDSGMGSI